MFHYDLEIVNVNLHRDCQVSVYLIDAMLKEELRLVFDERALTFPISNTDTWYLYLRKNKLNKWILTIAATEVPIDPKLVEYSGVCEVTLSDLRYIQTHKEERYRVIKTLLPIKVVPEVVNYYYEDLHLQAPNN